MVLFYALTGLINAFTSSVLSAFVYFKNRKANLNRKFALFVFSVAIWSFGYWFWLTAKIPENALFWTRIFMMGAIFIPIFYFHFTCQLLSLDSQKKKLLLLGYFLSFIFLFLNLTPFFITGVTSKLFFPYWPNPGIAFHPFLLFFFGYVVYSWYLMFIALQRLTGIKREQVKYVLIATVIGFLGGATNYLLWYDIPVPPFGNGLVAVSVAVMTYAIVRYRLMDIRVALGKGMIWLFSFTIVVGFGLALTYLNIYFGEPLANPILSSFILIFSILVFQPLLHLFEKFASKHFYYTFYSYQRVLTDLGKGLVRILDLTKLSSLIVNTLVNTMKLDRVVILLREDITGDYKILKNIGFKEENGISLVKDNVLTQYLEKTQKPLVQEELSLIIRDTRDKKEKEKLVRLKENMIRIEASLCLPLLIEEKIIGIIVLGNKISGDPYSSQDMELLINLANQSSIALENARLYKKVKDLSENLEQKVHQQTKKIQDLLEMKSEFLKVVTHQLNTPASIVKGMLSMMAEGSVKGEKLKEFIQKAYLSSERLVNILDDILVAQSLTGGGEVVNLSPCQIEEIVEEKVLYFKDKAELKNLRIIFEKSKTPLPFTLADSEMLKRVIFKLLDNAILYTRKGEIKISLNLRKEKDQNIIVISVKDSGIGLDEEDKKNLFKPFFRGEKAIGLHPNGTGLGLFIVEQFVKMHQGKIEVKSEGRDKGTEFIIQLPVITEL